MTKIAYTLLKKHTSQHNATSPSTHFSMHCNTLQHALQHSATYTATYCNMHCKEPFVMMKRSSCQTYTQFLRSGYKWVTAHMSIRCVCVCVTRDHFRLIGRAVYMCHTTLSYVWQKPNWLKIRIYVWVISYEWVMSHMKSYWLISTCVLVWHDSFICVTWLIHMCDTTHSYV